MRYTHLPITFLKSLLYEGRRKKKEKKEAESFHPSSTVPLPPPSRCGSPRPPATGSRKGKRPTVSPMGLVENVLLKGLLLLDTGVGVVIVLVRGKDTGWAVRAGSPG